MSAAPGTDGQMEEGKKKTKEAGEGNTEGAPELENEQMKISGSRG